MSRYRVIAMTVLAWLGAACISQAAPADVSADNASARIILVTYNDSSIERKAAIGTAGRRYARRSSYGATAWGRRMADMLSREYNIALMAQWPITELGVYCVQYGVPEGVVVDDLLDRLSHDRRIESAQPMNEFHTMAHKYNDPYYGLQNNIHLMQVDAAHQYTTGKGVRIVVIDTGIASRHPDLYGQVIDGRDFLGAASEQSAVYDAHGTAVAGVISAIADNGLGIVGIAPDARLIALKACAPSEKAALRASCNSLMLARALNAAIRMKPDIINLSLGGPPDPLLRRLIQRALDQGIVVVAAGSVRDGEVSFPASMEGVIGVSNEREYYQLTDEDMVVAPGDNVLTTVPGSSYEYVSGSSISAASVSGLIALMFELSPELAPDDIASYMARCTTAQQSNAFLVVDACMLLEQIKPDVACGLN